MKRLVFVLLCALGVVSPGAAASVDCAAVGELPAVLSEKPTEPLCSGDSAPIHVDTRTGTVRTARLVETLTYSVYEPTYEYLVIDISGGSSATTYPTWTTNIPASLVRSAWTNDEYRTTKLVMRRIEPGTFTMGDGGYGASKHTVTLTKPYYMGVFEVTAGQYKQVTGKDNPSGSTGKTDLKAPVEQVTWNMIMGADGFISNVVAKAGLKGFDLPTEAQWEYACRAGTQTAYYYGDTADTEASTTHMWDRTTTGGWEAGGGTKVVGTAPGELTSGHPWGLYDIHGNVFEWCHDWYDATYYQEGQVDPTGPVSGSKRVLRGGSWGFGEDFCRSANRYFKTPSEVYYNYGFRPVWTLTNSAAAAASDAEATVKITVTAAGQTTTLASGLTGTGTVEWVPSVPGTNTLRHIATAADGKTILSDLVAQFYVDVVKVQPQSLEHATAKVYTNGVEVAGPPFEVISNATVKVVYTAEDDYYFPDGSTTFETQEFKADKNPTTVPPELLPKDPEYVLTVGTVQQRYPWNGLVDIQYKLFEDIPTNYNLKVWAVNHVTGVTNEAATVTAEATPLTKGTHTLTWDMNADGFTYVSSNVVFVLGAEKDPWTQLYTVVNLEDGSVVGLDAAPADLLSNDAYKSTELVMRRIEPGTFTMGDGQEANAPKHTVTLTKTYYMAVFQVTAGQYKQVMGANPSGSTGATNPKAPVDNVSWNTVTGAGGFISKVAAKMGLKGFDLPTEAQWEYACRAGTQTAYYYGDTANDGYMWYAGNGGSKTHVVGTATKEVTAGGNPWGLYDMHGNVLEWCHDWYGESYYKEGQVDPTGPVSGSYRILRSGGWYSGADTCRSARRSAHFASYMRSYYGFRLVRTLSNPAAAETVASRKAAAVAIGAAVWAASEPTALDLRTGEVRDAKPVETLTFSTGYGEHKAVQLWEGGPYFATCNVGAENPEEYGYYFWWGDTVGYKRNAADDGWVSSKDGITTIKFSESDTTASQTYIKTIAQLKSAGWIGDDGNLVISDDATKNHDAARAHRGSPWRMMTNEEIEKLVDTKYCNRTWIENWAGTGINGYVVTGATAGYTDKSIFLPAAGRGYSSGLVHTNSAGVYWSSTPHSSGSDFACYLSFDSDLFYKQTNDRYRGYSVRPVRTSDAEPTVKITVTAAGQTTELVTTNGTGTIAWTPSVLGTNELHHIVTAADGTTVITNLMAKFYVAAVTVQPQAVEHATAKVYTNGVEVAGPPFEVISNATVKVVYTAEDGYYFPDGLRTFDTGAFTADKNPTEVPQDKLPKEPEYVLTVGAVQQRYPWNGLVDIQYKLLVDMSAGYNLKVWAVDQTTGETNEAVTVTAEATPLAKGTHTLTWDMNADGFTYVSSSVVFAVGVEHGGVQLWENGPYFATCNVGAKKPEDYGYYFWWGDTVGYTNTVGKITGQGIWYSVADGTTTITFNNTAPANSTYYKTIAQLQIEGWIDVNSNLVVSADAAKNHDAARAHWGSPWRIMTDEELQALVANTETVWTNNWNNTGVKGRIVRGKNAFAGKSIFLPEAGTGNGAWLSNPDWYGYYWSSTPESGDPSYAWFLLFGSDNFDRASFGYRCGGSSVRPVRASASGEVVWGTSEPTALDLRTGEVRDAKPVETLTFTTNYPGGAFVDITVNGAAWQTGLTGSGTVAWTPSVLGTNELHHIVTAADGTTVITNLMAKFYVPTPLVTVTPQEVANATAKVYTNGVEVAGPPFDVYSNATVTVVYTAEDGYVFPDGSRTFDTGEFTADKNPTTVPLELLPKAPEPILTVGTVQQRYPWNGLVDIQYKLLVDMSANYVLKVWAVNQTTGETNEAATVTAEEAPLAKGTHTLTWDMDKDGVKWVSDDVVFVVGAEEDPWTKLYAVVDLEDGAVAGLDAAPEDLLTDEDYRKTKLVMRRIEPGTFTMGDGAADAPKHKVTLTKPYYMGVFQVTAGQYERVTGLTPSGSTGKTNPKAPVDSVPWNTVMGDGGFISKVVAKAGLAGFDLPTEAQWEYACRAGTTNVYYYGDTGDGGYMWYNDNSGDATHVVGTATKESTAGGHPWGLYDMHGNVWEWCHDWYGAGYYKEGQVDPTGPSSGSVRVMRGGSWGDYASSCRSAYRCNDYPSSENDSHGFRLVRTLSNPAAAETVASRAAVGAARGKTIWGASEPTAVDLRTGEVRDAKPVETLTFSTDYGAHKAVQLWEGGPCFAACNIGAQKPEDYGYYFWWGDTVGYTMKSGTWSEAEKKYTSVVWQTGTGSVEQTSSPFASGVCATYNKGMDALLSEGWIGADDNLVAEHDAATAHWGPAWRMMTHDEFGALCAKVEDGTVIKEFVAVNGVKGVKLTGTGAFANNWLFIPAAGGGDDTTLDEPGSIGYLLSSTPDSEYPTGAWGFDFALDSFQRASYSRYQGMTVRPVLAGDITVTITVNGEELVTTNGTGTIEWTPSVPGTNELHHIVTAADGTTVITNLMAKFYVDATPTVEVTPQAVEHATAKVYTNGVEVAGPPFNVYSNATVTVVYTAEDGYAFPDGSRTFDTGAFTADKNPTEVPQGQLPKDPPTAVTITGVEAQQRYPWNGMVDIAYELSGDMPSGYELKVWAINGSVTNEAKTVSSEATPLTKGMHTLTWDMNADGFTYVSDDVVFAVGAAKQLDAVQLWAGGPYFATSNVGATKPAEFGYYFWWGDTVGYKRNAENNGWISVTDGTPFEFNEENCGTYEKTIAELLAQDYVDANGNLTADCDAARAKCGEPWRMMTAEEVVDFTNNCTWAWVDNWHNTGTNGYEVSGKDGYAANGIFLPAAGYGQDAKFGDPGKYGNYWAATADDLNPSNSFGVGFNDKRYDLDSGRRFNGMTVRPVCDTASDTAVWGASEPTALDLRTGVVRDAAIGETETLTFSTDYGAHKAVQLWAGGPCFATCNIGAEKPTEFGYHFWWGDTVGYTNTIGKAEGEGAWYSVADGTTTFAFTAENCPTYGQDVSQLKSAGYIDDDANPYLNAAHDAATAHWGSSWRMPTYGEIGMLANDSEYGEARCIWTPVEEGGSFIGWRVSGKGDYAGNSIFLPAVGYGDGTGRYFPYCGYYWSSTPVSDSSEDAWGLYFESSEFRRDFSYRWNGFTIRPVRTGDVTVTITVNGEELVTTNGTGTVAWTPSVPGTNELHHIVTAADGTTITNLVAKFYVPTSVLPTITGVEAQQRYPWNGLVDIAYELSGDMPAGYALKVRATDLTTGEIFEAQTVTTEAAALAKGAHTLTWDMNADGYTFVSTNVSFAVVAAAEPAAGEWTKTYVVVDLSKTPYAYEELDEVPEGGWTDEHKTTKLVLRRIEPGTFTMGVDTNQYSSLFSGHDDTPHSVMLTSPYYIGVFEVTQKQWEQVMGTRPSYFTNETCYATRPVENVTYAMIRGSGVGAGWPKNGAVDETSFMGVFRRGAGLSDFDLPTEAQWEYACRAGTQTLLNSGKDPAASEEQQDDNLDEVARNYYNCGKDTKPPRDSDTTKGTAAVGSYDVNAWGLYDMHGNVWDWCLDWYGGDYGAAPAVDPRGAKEPDPTKEKEYRILRGGSWLNKRLAEYTSPCRGGGEVAADNMNCGFRMVRTLQPSVGGASEPTALDLRTGVVRDAALGETETLTYTTNYPGGATVDITVNGVTQWMGLTGSGTVAWTPSVPGTNELAHIVKAADGTTITNLVAKFYVAGIQVGDTAWAVVKDGVCTIVGTGDMWNHTQWPEGKNPLADYSRKIKNIVFADGVTSVGSKAFQKFYNVTNVACAASVTNVADYAFLRCNSLDTLAFAGSDVTFGKTPFALMSAIYMKDGMPVVYPIPQVTIAGYTQVLYGATELKGAQTEWTKITTEEQRAQYHFFQIRLEK